MAATSNQENLMPIWWWSWHTAVVGMLQEFTFADREARDVSNSLGGDAEAAVVFPDSTAVVADIENGLLTIYEMDYRFSSEGTNISKGPKIMEAEFDLCSARASEEHLKGLPGLRRTGGGLSGRTIMLTFDANSFEMFSFPTHEGFVGNLEERMWRWWEEDHRGFPDAGHIASSINRRCPSGLAPLKEATPKYPQLGKRTHYSGEGTRLVEFYKPDPGKEGLVSQESKEPGSAVRANPETIFKDNLDDRHPDAIPEGTSPPKAHILTERPTFPGRRQAKFDRHIREYYERDELHEDEVERFRKMGVI